MLRAIVSVALLILGLAGCSTTPNKSAKQARNHQIVAPVLLKPALALVPRARTYTGEVSPVIRHIISKSPADRNHFALGDQILSLNGETITSALEFEQKIRRAPQASVITFRRNGKIWKTNVELGSERPRFGAGFEPEGVALIRKSSPYISFMYQKEIRAFAETSINDEQNLLHLNVILDSTKPVPASLLKYSLFDKGSNVAISNGIARVDALGSGSRIISKAFHRSSGFKGPIAVALEINGKQFHFEFQ